MNIYSDNRHRSCRSLYMESNNDVEKSAKNVKKESDIYLFGFNVQKFDRCTQFLIGTVGVFVFFIIYGYLQERIFLIPGFKPYGWYLTWCQFIVYTFLAACELLFFRIKLAKVPWCVYLLIAFLTFATMGLSNSAVGYLNYPTQVIFKCCKLIPTMIGGIIIQKIKYTKLDYISILMMVIGLIWFTLADSKVHPNFNVFGIILISLALCADGAIGNYQEKAMKTYNITSIEMVFFSYMIGFVMITLVLVVTGTFKAAFLVCAVEPMQTYGMFAAFSLTGYFGVQFILLLIKNFGALPAVTVSTCRKAVTIILSFIFFKKTFTITYVYSGLVVVMGIYLNLYSKNQEKWKPKISLFLKRTHRSLFGGITDSERQTISV